MRNATIEVKHLDQDVVSKTSNKICSIVIENMKKHGFINVSMENFDDCAGVTAKLCLSIWNQDVKVNQVVSDCLTLDENMRVRQTVIRTLEPYEAKIRINL